MASGKEVTIVSLAVSSVSWRRLWVGVLAAWLLTACGAVPLAFDRQLIGDAISLQLQQTQRQLSSQLRLADEFDWKVERVKVEENAPVTIQDRPSYHLRGTYTLVVELPSGRKTRPNQPFDLYIQGQEEGKTWRLARYVRQEGDREPHWTTYLIAPDDY